MTRNTASFDLNHALRLLEKAVADDQLSQGADLNIRRWLTEDRYSAYAAEVARHLEQGKWEALEAAFWTVIPFGTGGRRGRMYPIGSNAINERTIGESAQGLAEYVKEQWEGGGELSCAIAYDTRHNSRTFAELCASIMVAEGFRVYFLEEFRSTPELSFLVRYKHCSCGIMVTASHNPPSDNAVKVYWSTGAQVLPPHDSEIIDRVMNVQEISKGNFQQAVDEGQVIFCKDEVDPKYLECVKGERLPGPRDLHVVYSPLHGVGAFSIVRALENDGFEQVTVFGPHAEPSGDFPNVPGHVSNPENPAVFDAIIDEAKLIGGELILATDPDADRMGCAAPKTLDPSGPWETFTGNQLGALLADYVLEQKQAAGQLSDSHYLVKTLVTTELIRRIGDSYGVKTYGELLVGFKWICGLMDEKGPDKFAFGTEESHGYLVGQYARDKDGAVACMLMAELAAKLKAEGKSVHEKLDALYWQHGYHAEGLLNLQMEGSQGMEQMKQLMNLLRDRPPASVGGLKVVAARDYLHGTRRLADGTPEPLSGPEGNLVILDLEETGNYVAARPSGTEPKVKFYMFTFVPAEQLADLESTRQEMAQRLGDMEGDLRDLVNRTS